MLKKLLKYEFKATARTFLPLYGALIVISIINKIFFALPDSPSSVFFQKLDIPRGIGMMVSFALIVAIFVLTAVVMIQRFYKNLLSDEGYLMFTLPVKTWQLIVSKLITALVWLFASVAVTMVSILIMVLDASMISELPRVFSEMWEVFFQMFGGGGIVVGFETMIVFLLSSICGVLQVYTAISLGHQFGKHRILLSFGTYLGLNVVNQTVTSLVFGAVMMLPNDWLNFSSKPTSTIGLFMLLPLVITIVFTVVYFFLTNYILSRKLNLE